MCETFTFYYICGHIAGNHSIECSKNVHARIEHGTANAKRGPPCPKSKYGSAPPRLHSPMSSCADTLTIKFVGPTLCEVCITTGEVNEYLKHVPSDEFAIFRSWKAILGLEKLRAKAGDEESAAQERFEYLDFDAEETNSAESMEYISLSDTRSESSAERSSKLSLGGPGTRNDRPPTMKKPPRDGELSAFMTRIAALKERAEKTMPSVKRR